MLTRIQHSGNAAQSGLDSFLFGNAAALIGSDLLVFATVSASLLFLIGLLFKEMKILAFDPEYAKVIGLPVKGLELVLTSLTVLAVVTGIQAVGVVLMAAMLITPAAAARFWTQDTFKLVVIAGFFRRIFWFGRSICKLYRSIYANWTMDRNDHINNSFSLLFYSAQTRYFCP